jgi:hypothetical protein
MNHQPFEQWILDPRDLTNADRDALNAHLETCQACQKLEAKWLSLSEEIHNTTMLAPRSGFSRRWQAGLAERKLREQRRQAWKFFMACSGAAAAIFLVMVAYFFFTSTPAEWIQAAMRAVTSTVGTVTTARDLASTWMSLTPLGFNVVIWIALGLTFCILACIWVFAIYRTAFAGVWNK